jgi:AraC-like DNA-binding protein
MPEQSDTAVDWIALARRARFAAPAMAGLLDISLRQLERAFLECTVGTPQVWLSHARLWHACALLQEGQSPKQFTEDLGFKSVTGFFHAFKAYHGCTAREYLVGLTASPHQGIARLKQYSVLCELLVGTDGELPPSSALQALNRMLQQSSRLAIYYLRSRCRRETPGVADGQQVSRDNRP